MWIKRDLSRMREVMATQDRLVSKLYMFFPTIYRVQK